MASASSSIINALTIDVEDYYHVSAFADSCPLATWPHQESRVVANTHKLLAIFDDAGVHGTFYILGWVAEHYPQLVKEIAAAGHEIGCHSYAHQLVYDLTRSQFREDLIRARNLLSDLISAPVTLYRAPSFSITRKSLWALEELVDAGFTTDSSIYPIRHDRYGIRDADPAPHCIETEQGTIQEFPGTCLKTMAGNLPLGGGGYFRLLPLAVTRHLLKQRAAKTGLPFMFYLHPWEVDPDQPRMRGSWKSRFRHYQNLGSTEAKLKTLLKSFSFGTVTQVIDSLESLNSYELSNNATLDYKANPENRSAPLIPAG